MSSLSVIVLLVLCCSFSLTERYEPNWKSLDSRPLPAWYDNSKIGIFIHWGVFSVPSFRSEWFWWYWQGPKAEKTIINFMKKNYRPDFTYADFAAQFTAEFFNPDQWADMFKASGARYIVFVSKHHEGFTNWPSKYSWNWNAGDVGPKRDIIGALAKAIRSKTKIHFGLYHSLFEWFNPLYNRDKANGFKTQDFVKTKTGPELYEIVNRYKPDIIWSDGSHGPDVYWNATNFLAWLYNDSPVKDTVVTNDRWGNGCPCHHGGFFTCHDRYNPGKLQGRKWENCFTLDKRSWGYRRDAKLSDFLTMDEVIDTLTETVSCGGNVLINVGPTHDGRIVPIFEERLRSLGKWLGVNGEAIYESTPWSYQNDTVTPRVWYTMKKGSLGSSSKVVYAIALDWPMGSTLRLAAPAVVPNTRVTLLGYPTPLTYMAHAGSGITINIPSIPINKMPCDYAWVFKMTYVKN